MTNQLIVLFLNILFYVLLRQPLTSITLNSIVFLFSFLYKKLSLFESVPFRIFCSKLRRLFEREGA